MAKRERETPDYGAMVRRMIRAYSRRVGAGDIAALPELLALRDELDAAIDAAVAELRGPDWQYSWAQIGEALGITRQAAQKRWRHLQVEGARQVGGQPAALR